MNEKNNGAKKTGCCGGRKAEEKHGCGCGEKQKHADNSKKNEKKQK
ncbi:MAG: hypothetical protein M1331_02605 [Candidatus Marsarchaeota archaeon]|nr:hypothetical protein [Candidatus Marsarchaeota archaeon]